MQLKFRAQITDELGQKQAVTDGLINKVLHSKRLLVDHVDALEQCLLHRHDTTKLDKLAEKSRKAEHQNAHDIFTARNACVLLGTTILEHLITPKPLRLTLIPSVLLTGGFSTLYVIKNCFIFRNKIVERELDNLIQNIDGFGNCIRRNMTYFNEISLMKQQELIESLQIERAWDCITAVKEVTEILYDATRKLEGNYPLPAKFSQYYSPMEELRECEYFKNSVTDYSPKHIKDFHNIFAYVQSQFLLRLALTVLTKPSISQLNMELVKIDCLIRQLVHEEEHHFKNLALELNKKNQMELDSLHHMKTVRNRSGAVAMLQDTSLKLSACMVAVAGECQNLDITLQRFTEADTGHQDNDKQLVQVADNMRSIEGALSVCFDDFQRLMLVYNKFLSSKLKYEDREPEKNDSKVETSDEEFPESFLRVEISRNHNDTEKRDDFYAYMFDEQEANAAGVDQEEPEEKEILHFEKRITKGKFRPVLKQLKDRIDPIRREMLEMERKVLAAKGINVDQLFGSKDSEIATETKDNREQDDDNDSESSADSETQRRRSKNLKECQNYAEARNFLAQKQPFGLPHLGLPKLVQEEDVSEC